MTSETHPLDQAREELFAATPKASLQLLKAKLSQINHRRADRSHALDNEIYRQHDPMGRTGGRAGHVDRFNAMPPLAEKARDETIEACLAAGIRDDAAIIKFVGADLFHFLHAYAMSRFGHYGGTELRFASNCGVTGTALSSRVKDYVTIARAAYNDTQPLPGHRWWQRLRRRPVIGGAITIVGFLLGAVWWLLGQRNVIHDVRELTSASPRPGGSASHNH